MYEKDLADFWLEFVAGIDNFDLFTTISFTFRICARAVSWLLGFISKTINGIIGGKTAVVWQWFDKGSPTVLCMSPL